MVSFHYVRHTQPTRVREMSSDPTEPGTQEIRAAFTIDMTPGDPAVDSTARFDFTKTWSGQIEGISRGLMLSAGNPHEGNAGYVAIEVFDGSIDGRCGSIVLQQFGTMNAGDYILRYEIAPGSGTDQLAGMAGKLDLEINDGHHNVTLHCRP
jgi:hypothetical protein